MATIRFYPKPQLNNTITIMCCISHLGQEKIKSLGYSLPANKQKDQYKFWANKLARGHDDAIDINTKMAAWIAKFNDYKGKVKRGEIDFDFEEAYDFIIEGKTISNTSLLGIITKFIAVQQITYGADNTIHYNTVRTDVIDFEKETKQSFKLTDINKDFYRKFGVFLSTDRGEVPGNINSTVNRKIGRIITIMGWAFENEYIDNQRYKIRYTFKGHDSSRFPLTEAEIAQLHSYQTNDLLERVVLDGFLFACHTGLRISDIQQLKPEHIFTHQDEEGFINYIDFTQVKGTKDNMIPLSKVALDLLQAHSDGEHFFTFKHGQSANRILKRVAKELKMDRLLEQVQVKGTETIKEMLPLHSIISFHFARNTYISLLLAKGVNPIFVQGNVGHSDLKTTMIYSKQAALTRWKETLKVQNGK